MSACDDGRGGRTDASDARTDARNASVMLRLVELAGKMYLSFMS